MIREAGDADRKKWDGFVSQNRGAQVCHWYGWRRVLENSFGLKTVYLLAESGGKISGLLPLTHQHSVLFGSYLISLAFFNVAGVLSSDPAARRDLTQAAAGKARELGVRYLELRHDAPDAAPLPAREHKVTFVLDLPQSSETLWKNLKDKVRNLARKGEKEGLVFREFEGTTGVDLFYPVFARNMRDLGSPVIARRFFENAAAAFPEKTRIFTASMRGRPVAAGFTLTHGGKMEIPWAASDWRFLKHSPNVFLYWNILRRACELGANRFDFGRCTKGGGTYQFKKQWGGAEIPLYWHYFLPDEAASGEKSFQPPFVHRFASAFWKRLPLPAASALGPLVSSKLPV